jgi:hypothetical protein
MSQHTFCFRWEKLSKIGAGIPTGEFVPQLGNVSGRTASTLQARGDHGSVFPGKQILTRIPQKPGGASLHSPPRSIDITKLLQPTARSLEIMTLL